MNTHEYLDPLCSLTPRELAKLEEIDRLVKARGQWPRVYDIRMSGATVLGGDKTALGRQLKAAMKRGGIPC
ncbi:MAG: hypothetical protein IV100_17690 [Myxococcales bacterium]|nr:hypothetical protein [Myxococcales bacterium]